MILYPTETIYALGVNGFDEAELAKLYEFKGRDEGKPSSLMVSGVEEIEKYAVLSPRALRVAEALMPGSITLVLPAKEGVSKVAVASDGMIRFRVPADASALSLAKEIYSESKDTGSPIALTCTSANVSGLPTMPTPHLIMQQFAENGRLSDIVERTIDDGPREGVPSTVVRVVGDEITVHREGAVPTEEILKI